MRRETRIRIAAATVALLGCVFTGLAAASYPLTTGYYEFFTDKVTRPYRVVLIADLHDTNYGDRQSQIMEMIDSTQPDLIAICGDMYDEKFDNTNTDRFMQLVNRYPCFFVAGNHEIAVMARYSEYRQQLIDYGITLLENRSLYFGELCLTGISQTPELRSFDKAILQLHDNGTSEALKDNGAYNILLAHYPDKFDTYCGFGTFDLVLAGHTHGGQWRIPGTNIGLFGPGRSYFPRYPGGRFESDGTTMIVSRGLSERKDTIPRLFNNPEIVVIDILPS